MCNNRKTSHVYRYVNFCTFTLKNRLSYCLTTINRSETICCKERRKSINRIFKGRRRSLFSIFLKLNGIKKNDRSSGIGLGVGSERAAKKKNFASGRRKNVGPDTRQSRYGAQPGFSLCGFAGRLRRRRLVLLLLLLLPHEPALLQ